MSHKILLYGATGYSGRLITAEGERSGMSDDEQRDGRVMLLGGRNARAVSELARRHRMDHRAFALDHPDEIARNLQDIKVIINAAGPFALTANYLARAALAAGCHYVDISSEPDVYMMLDDLHQYGVHRHIALLSGAGHSPAASDLMLHAALRSLSTHGTRELGTIRIALSRPQGLSRGSIESISRMVREQVRVVRLGEVPAGGKRELVPVFCHESVGRLERSFDFGHYDDDGQGRDLRISTAVNVADTLTARLTLYRHGVRFTGIESYVEAGSAARWAHQLASLVSPLAAIPAARELVRWQANILPVGPTARERRMARQVAVLEIEDPFHEKVVNWRWHTPNAYDFTARVAVAAATALVGTTTYGWLTPSEVLNPEVADLTAKIGYLRDCRLHAA
jgi:short subunit dehydrogenase-like uncharacterized protein